MRVRALTNFSGVISMAKGCEQEIKDDFLLTDLLQAHYVEEVKVELSKKKSPKRSVKENEGQ